MFFMNATHGFPTHSSEDVFIWNLAGFHYVFIQTPTIQTPRIKLSPSQPRANVVMLLVSEKRHAHYAQIKRLLVKICRTKLACFAPQARFRLKSWRMKPNDRRK